MKRSWNPRLWVGIALALASIVSYPLYFLRFPVMRDSPWVTLALLAVGVFLMATGLARAFRRPDAYRGKIAGSILGGLTILLVGLFLTSIFYLTRKLPASKDAPKVGEVAPDFTLPDSMQNNVNLASLLSSDFTPEPPASDAKSAKTAAVVLIFYRGYW